MKPARLLLVLERIEQAAEIARAHLAGLTREQFLTDKKTQDAVCYALIGLGEAAKILSAGFREAHPEIPWGEVVKMRDYLAHGYTTVEPEILWDTVQRDIEPLVREVRRIRAQADETQEQW